MLKTVFIKLRTLFIDCENLACLKATLNFLTCGIIFLQFYMLAEKCHSRYVDDANARTVTSYDRNVMFLRIDRVVEIWFQASAAMLMKSAVFWGVTRRHMVIVYRRFGTNVSFPSSLVKSPVRCPETSVNNYHTTPRNTPENRRF
jgi:hypothetical protein